MTGAFWISVALLLLPGWHAAGSAASRDQQVAGVLGDWRTPGGAAVEVAKCGQDVCATLLQLEPNAPTRVDGKNPDPAKRTEKLCGLRIGYGFRLNDADHAEDGHLYDPKTGKTYQGSMASQGDTLRLRGYVGIKAFGRTEVWQRTGPVSACS